MLRTMKYEPFGNAERLFSFLNDSMFTKHSKKSPKTVRYQITQLLLKPSAEYFIKDCIFGYRNELAAKSKNSQWLKLSG